MDEEQRMLAHLTMVQNVINRMGNNSFLIKGWAIGLLPALLALLWGKWYLGIMLIPVISFWYLDSFYLRQERLYRNLYNKIISEDRLIAKYSMNTEGCEDDNAKLRVIFFSPTVAFFYGTMIALMLSYYLFLLMKLFAC